MRGKYKRRKKYREWLHAIDDGKNDPVWFVKNILGIDLLPYQEYVLKELMKYKKRGL